MTEREEEIRVLIGLIEYIRDDLVKLQLDDAAHQLNAAVADLRSGFTTASPGNWVSCGDH